MLEILSGLWAVVWGLLTLIDWFDVLAAVFVIKAMEAGWWQFKKFDNWMKNRFPEKDS